jgi:hypothetical protein
MGGGKKSKAPAAPNYEALQASDALANRYTAQEITKWNRPNQYDAFGNSITWTQDGSGNWTQQQRLAPQFEYAQSDALKAFRDSAWTAANQGGFQAPSLLYAANEWDELNANGNFDPNAYGSIGSFDRSQGDQVAKDMFESSMSRLRPEMARTQEALDVKLRQQGLQPGTEAYNRAMQNEMTSQGDVTAKLGLDATGAGYNAAMGIYNTNLGGQAQRFNQGLAGYDANRDQDMKAFQTRMQLQKAEYDQALQNYALPMERAQAAAQLYASAPQPNFPGFSGATGYNPADMTGAAQAGYQAKMGNVNAQAGKKNSMLGAGTSLGSAFLGSK